MQLSFYVSRLGTRQLMKEALTTDQVLSMVVGLVRCCDGDIVEPGFLSQTGIHPQNHHRVITLRDHIQRLVDEYDYIQSPAFLRGIAGRSPEFRAMKTKLEQQPEKRASHAQAFSNALASIRRDDSAYDLLSSTHQHLLDVIRLQLSAIDEHQPNLG